MGLEKQKTDPCFCNCRCVDALLLSIFGSTVAAPHPSALRPGFNSLIHDIVSRFQLVRVFKPGFKMSTK